MNKLILEYDDFHWDSPENCLDTIYKFVGKYPRIKITLFTPTALRGKRLSQNKLWCIEVSKIKQIKLAAHGHLHNQEEFKDLSYHEAIEKLEAIDVDFKYAGLEYLKVFRGPHWGINYPVLKALEDFGYTHLYNHSNYEFLRSERLQIVYYNWNLAENSPTGKLVIAHGHTHNVCNNGIVPTFDKVCNYIDEFNPIFEFADYI